MSSNFQSRRQFLRGLGGLTLSLPFLESLAPAQALAQVGSPPKRFIALIAPLGYHEPVYYPSVEADIKLSEHIYYKTLSSIPGALSECLGNDFDAHRSKMNILRGLDVVGAFGHSPITALCAARRLVNGDYSPIDPPGDCRSIDVVLGKSSSFYPTAPAFKALRADESIATLYSIDRDGLGNIIQLPHTRWPYDMFTSVFGNTNLDAATATALRNKKTTIGDLVLNSYKSLVNDRRISANDKVIVSNFVTQVQELNKKIMTTANYCAGPAIGPARLPFFDLLTEAEQQGLTLQFIDIMVAAMACDLTRVSVIALGADTYRHGVSHTSYYDRIGNVQYIDIQKKYQNPFVKAFVSKLDAITESNGKTMLDNSIVLWGGEQSAGNAHCSVSMPAITFGSMNGAIKTGYYVDYRQRPFKYYANRSDIFPAFGSETYNQLFNTIFQGLGVPPAEYEQYGDGGGYGSFDFAHMQYMNGEYDSLKPKRKNTLPFISLI